MDTSEELKRLGQYEYKRRNFHGALSYFSSVISAERMPAVDVLDGRAATYEKLGDLHAALKDGRRMITDYKTSCAGYLRTGKTLQLLEKYTTALGIYQYGLRNVPPSDPNFALLRQMYDEVSRTCDPRRAGDPLTVLPAEIAEMILSYLDFRQIVSLTRVSRKWQDYLTSMPSLWSKLDFSAAKARIPGSAIQNYLRCSSGLATEVVISRSVGQQQKFLPHIARVCRNLEILRITNDSPNESLIKAVSIARHLKSLSLSATCGTTLDCVSQILRYCSTLARAEFHYICAPDGLRPPSWPSKLPKLHVLTLKLREVRPLGVSRAGPEYRTMPSIDPLLEQLPDIRELSLANWSSQITVPTPGEVEMSHLHKLTLLNFQGNFSLQDLPSLRSIELNRCSLMFKRFSISGFKPDRRVHGYSKFSTSYAGLESEKLIQLIGSRSEDLRHLSITHCHTLYSSDLIKMVRMGYMDQVVHLDLSGTQVTDDVIEALVSRAKQLRTMVLAATRITGISVKALVMMPDIDLVHLDVNDCSHVSSDATNLARTKKGLKVLSSVSELKYNAKRIRYG